MRGVERKNRDLTGNSGDNHQDTKARRRARRNAWTRARLRASAGAGAPTSIGMIWLAEAPVCQPAAWRRWRRLAAAPRSWVRRPGSAATMSRAAIAAAAIDAGWAVEKT